MLTGLARYEEALAHFEQALAINPNPRAQVLSNLGVLYLRTGRPGEAIPLFRRSLALRSDLPRMHENLAAALLATGNRSEAIAELEAALRLDPSADQARRMLAAIRSGAS